MNNSTLIFQKFVPATVLATSALLTACGGGGGGSAPTTINEPPEITSALVLENRTEVVFGDPVTLQATAIDPEDGDISSAVVWVSDLEGELGTGASLEASFAQLGQQTITATVTDNDGTGKSATSAPIEIDVLPDPVSLYIKASNTEGEDASCIASETGQGCDNFGFAVAVSEDGSTLVVGAPFEDGNANAQEDSGAVYVYRDSGTGTWDFEAILRAPDAGNRFGSALALNFDGSVLAVTGSGTGYVYLNVDSSWSAGTALADTFSTDFTASVALNSAGDLLAVGSAGDESVYVYTLAGDVATADGLPLIASNQNIGVDLDDGDKFGIAIALDEAGGTLIVGASQESSASAIETDNSAPGAGAAYIFEREMGVWNQVKYLKAEFIQANSGFGAAVAINADGTRVAIGAPQENISGDEPASADDLVLGDDGAAYVFAEAGDWAQASRAVVAVANSDPGDNFGNTVALTADGLTLFVGARGEDSQAKNLNGSQTNDFSTSGLPETFYNAADSGAVYAFDVSALAGTQTTYYKAFNSAEGDKFGRAIAISADGSKLAVGANLEDGSGQGVEADLDNVPGLQAGAVYLFR